jgi:hypothetical protein
MATRCCATSTPRSARVSTATRHRSRAKRSSPRWLPSTCPRRSRTPPISPDLDDDLRAGNRAALDPIGEDLGVPAIHVDGNAFFGPVVSPVPRGEEAGRLWDGVLLVTGTPGFFELKRGRSSPVTS